MNQREEILQYGIMSNSEEQGAILKGLGYVFDPINNMIYEGEFNHKGLHGEGTK